MKRRHLSTKDRASIFAAGGGDCYLCGGKIAIGEAWEAEHPIPFALGGDDSVEALRPAHVKCHRAKTDQDVTRIAKAKRVAAKNDGTYRAPRAVIPGSKGSRFKKKLNGAVEWR